MKSDKGDFVTYIIDDTEVNNFNKNTVIVIAITSDDVKLSKIKNLGDICVQLEPDGKVTKGVSS